jgi:adenosylcobinamide-phosphate synthase
MILHAKACVDKGKVSAEGVQKIVSRDTSSLSEPQLCSATIESIAENFVDGVFAPLFYFSIFGLPGAVIYRAVNVCDAMVGYRNEKYEFFGKFAAKLDDVLNYVPARLSLLLFEFFKSGAIRYGIEKNVKLNGCAIAAMSYILGVRLEKPGYYSLEGKNPDVSDVMMAIEYFKKLSILAVLTALMITSIRLLLLT